MAAVRVWDPVLRLCHWTLAAAVLTDLFWIDDGDSVHAWVGYAAVVVIALRLAWGLRAGGMAHPRDFLPTWPRIRAQLAELRALRGVDAPGHHPLGALLMLFMLALVPALALTGWLQGTDRFWGEAWLQDLHDVLADVLLAALAVHVGAALLLSVLYRSNLILAMITGVKQLPEAGTPKSDTH